MTKVFLKVVLLLFIPFLGFTQVSHSNHIHSSSCCVGGEMTPADRQGFAKTFLEWKKENDLTKRQARALLVRYSLPVVFHLIEGTPAITDAQVEVALASLNNAYSRSNDYGGAQDFTNAAGGADTQIEFCLAQST